MTEPIVISTGKFEGADLRTVPLDELRAELAIASYSDRSIIRAELRERFQRSKYAHILANERRIASHNRAT